MMKKDMGGAASLLGLASAIMEAKLPVRLRVMVPAVENAVAGNAFRPLDIIKTRKGMTVEVGNTDAEGRLILCDALYEACGEKPALLIDMATLTGAARTALGPELPALFSNDDDRRRRVAAFRPGRKRSALAPAAVEALSPDDRVADRRPQQRLGIGLCRRDHRRALSRTRSLRPVRRGSISTPMPGTRKAGPGRPEGGEALALRALYALIEHRFGRGTN